MRCKRSNKNAKDELKTFQKTTCESFNFKSSESNWFFTKQSKNNSKNSTKDAQRDNKDHHDKQKDKETQSSGH